MQKNKSLIEFVLRIQTNCDCYLVGESNLQIKKTFELFDKIYFKEHETERDTDKAQAKTFCHVFCCKIRGPHM